VEDQKAPLSSTAPGPPALDGVVRSVFGDYELLEEIGHGGMGVVYKARHRSLGRTVALKKILPGRLNSETAVQRFHQEARAAAMLDHPHIVPIYEVGECDSCHYYTMTFVEGPTLSAMIRKNGPLDPRAAASAALAVAEAIAHAHGRGIIHRDLKPDNVLMDPRIGPRVTDFGLAKCIEQDAGLTQPGEMLGTPHYMAPEQALPQTEKVGPRADVYGLGGILYFLLAGQPPYQGDPAEVLFKLIEPGGPVPPQQFNPQVPEGLQAVCLKCLEKDPQKRYATAAELAAALRPWTIAETQPPSRRRRRVPAAVTITVLIALTAVGLLTAGWWWGAGPAGGQEVLLNDPLGEEPEAADLVSLPSRHDFVLNVEMLGGKPNGAGPRSLTEGEKVAFCIKVDRDAHVGIWTIAPDQKIVQLFPNEFEPDHLIRAGRPRTVPSGDYVIEATVSGGTERVWVVASTEPWDEPQGRREGPFVIFKTVQERRNWEGQLRGLLVKPAPKGGVATDVQTYRVWPRRDPRPR
jgi:serine/threonine protein kinase